MLVDGQVSFYMKNKTHLSDKQLIDYSENLISIDEKEEIGRHLLFCTDCRERLPVPTVELFLNAIMDESEKSN